MMTNRHQTSYSSSAVMLQQQQCNLTASREDRSTHVPSVVTDSLHSHQPRIAVSAVRPALLAYFLLPPIIYCKLMCNTLLLLAAAAVQQRDFHTQPTGQQQEQVPVVPVPVPVIIVSAYITHFAVYLVCLLLRKEALRTSQSVNKTTACLI